MKSEPIDVTLNLLSDAGGRDPDSHSKALRRYHRQLWSRPLPDGTMFELDERLRYTSPKGEGSLASDAITNSYRNWLRPAWFVQMRAQVSDKRVQELFDAGCTVGAYIVFPYANEADGHYPPSMNQSRGTRSQIRDRMDLTLECIRRHYLGEASPLSPTIDNVSAFFDLFEDFDGYVSHFLLVGLVTPDGQVAYLTDHVDLSRDGLPGSATEYETYIRRSTEFVAARNRRIAEWSGAQGA